jgi:hypothetical protein
MAKKRVSKKKKFLTVVKNTPASSGLRSVSMRSDYFARFRYSPEETLIILETEAVRSLQINSQTREILDDLGYWSLIRNQESGFIQDSGFKEQITAQCEYLHKALSYNVGDIVWVKKHDNVFVQARIIEEANVEDSDFYAVEMYSGDIKEFQIYSKYELDQVNQAGCFLPQDTYETEVIDWDKDLIWKKRLEDFKVKMAEKKFHVDFKKSSEEIETKISELTEEILEFFKINIGESRQLGRGLGLRSCGQGNKMDQYLIYICAFQALGHVFGIRLAATQLAKDFFSELNNNKLSLASFRSIAEVADKLVARGPLAINGEHIIKELDRNSRKTVVEIYAVLKTLSVRRSLSKAISESAIFSNIVKFNANSI